MLLSIVIPHRKRRNRLALCLWSIHRGAALCGIIDYEVIVVDNGSPAVPAPQSHVDVIVDREAMEVFNKPRLQNIGIEAAAGDILAFLDADAIVGPRWMESVNRLVEDPSLTRLCWRVRYLPEEWVERLGAATDAERESLLAVERASYDSHELSWESYGNPTRDKAGSGPVFGNSQFAIRRDVLGDLRYHEGFVGSCYEDLWLIRELWYRCGVDYKAEIVTDADHAIFHLANTRGPDWWSRNWQDRNTRLYGKTAKPDLEKQLEKEWKARTVA